MISPKIENQQISTKFCTTLFLTGLKVVFLKAISCKLLLNSSIICYIYEQLFTLKGQCHEIDIILKV
jgi:hypothetical protein